MEGGKTATATSGEAPAPAPATSGEAPAPAPAENPQETTNKQLREIMEKTVDSEEALSKAFRILVISSGDQQMMKHHTSADVIQRAMPALAANVKDEEIDEVILHKAKVENRHQINVDEFTSIMRYIWKRVADSVMKEIDVVSDETLKKAFVVLAKEESACVSAAFLRRVIPFLGYNLSDKDIIEDIKKVKNNVDDDGQINREQFIQIIRTIWKKSGDLLWKARGKDADKKDVDEAFRVLSNKLDDAVSSSILRVVMLNLSDKLKPDDVDTIMYYASLQDQLIKKEGFTEIMLDLTGTTTLNKIYRVFSTISRNSKRKFILLGESGVGKTWMATKIANRATRDAKLKFDLALWVNLKGMNLLKIIAHQLSLLSVFEEMETSEVKEEVLEQGKRKIKILEERIHEAIGSQSLLLIFDGVESKDDFEKDLCQLRQVLNLDNSENHKFLITTTNHKLRDDIGDSIGVEVKRFTNDESTLFMTKKIGDDKFSKVEDLAKFYIERSRGLPAKMVLIAKTLSYFVDNDRGLQRLEGVKKVVLEDEAHDNDGYCNIETLFVSTELVPKIVLVDCYSAETPAEHFLNARKGVHYNELISYWILEGHLGKFSSINDAYMEGHRVLMELLDCGLLKTLKAGYVKSSGYKFEFSVQDYFNLYQNTYLRLATTFENKLGNTVLGDGMINTYPSDKEKDKKEKKMEEEREDRMSTLLLDGDRTGEVSDSLFENMKDLENLAIFNPTPKPFPLPISHMHKLCFLVLRGCEFLKSFDHVFKLDDIKAKKPRKEAPSLQRSNSMPLQPVSVSHLIYTSKVLSKLTVLEISGPSSLKIIPEYLFESMENLKSLNMSSLQMESLPGSFYNQTAVEILILRDCSSLKRIESLKKFKRLQLLDLSGATSLMSFKDKSFSGNQELQTINLSQSNITKFPLVHSLRRLQYLSLRECPALTRVRKIGKVKSIRVFDISGSRKVEQLLDPKLGGLGNLFALNVSGTAIRRLPSTIGKPRYLYLSDCFHLKQLPPIETLSELLVLDLSGSTTLDDVKEGFLTSLKCLVELNLSKTGVVSLPSLSSLIKLQRLLISHSRRLEKLEGLGSLTKLEVLDLSGCTSLSMIEDQSFDHMDRLLSLDLSETKLEKLPSLSNLRKLEELNLRGCAKLTDVPGLEDLSVLRVLNISRTTLKVPNFKNPNCHPNVHGPRPSSFEIYDPIKLLKDLGVASGTPVPTLLQQHEQTSEETQIEGGEKTMLPQEVDQYEYRSISSILASHNGETIDQPVIDVHFLTIKQFHFFVHPMEVATHPFDTDLLRNELVLRNIYLEEILQHVPAAQERCLEIRGFRDFPMFLEQVLKYFETIVLVDNSCIKFVSDLGADNIKEMKVCWIERCNGMEYVACTDNAEKSSNIVAETIEILWVSEAGKLQSICKKTPLGISFKRLKSLYLEYCPELSTLCFSSEELSGLKILHVKHCQKLSIFFDNESAQLPNLHSLHLWALPELKKISCGMQCLQTFIAGHCPLLEYIFDSKMLPQKLESLQVKYCDNIKAIQASKSVDILQNFPLLKPESITTLGCPKLDLSKLSDSGITGARNPSDS